MKKNIPILWGFLAGALLLASESQGDVSDLIPKIPRLLQSYAPILGYDPVWGWIGGGAAFLNLEKPDPMIAELQAMGGNGLYNFVGDLKRVFPSWPVIMTHHEFSNFFDPYFGEGDSTLPRNQVQLGQTRYLGKVTAMYRHEDSYFTGLFVDYRYRRLQGSNWAGLGLRQEEASGVLGVSFIYDSRDNEYNPSQGFYNTTSLSWCPYFFSATDAHANFWQTEVDMRYYRTLWERLCAAIRLNVGVSMGDPTYLYRFELGGPEKLRGYLLNRFRGSQFYLGQFELRNPLFWIVGADAFFDVGDVSDKEFTNARVGAGGGFYILLPPDNIKVARIEYGFGQDQQVMYMSFAHAF